MSNYRLSCVITGHELDVRTMCPASYPEGAVITGSRDRTARLWISSDGKRYEEGHCMSGHSNFVASVCVLPATDEYPHGLIMTGSNDSKINAYTLEKPTPVYTLEGHGNTVSSLAAGKFGTLLSGSWDTTAKVWLKQKCMMTLEGHAAAVWDVAYMSSQGLMLTASADKTIKLWKAGKCERTYKGHEDCVRALAIVSDVTFLSASNDTTIRLWELTGVCIQQFHGHTNFIFSLSLLPNGAFVSSGEDRTVRVWQHGEMKQTITLPAQSVWCVVGLPNGDIAAGSSDGITRIFTKEPSRFADPDVQEIFEKQLASFAMPAKTQAFGDIKMEDLPGPSDLEKTGTKDGQTKLIRNGNVVEAYSWSMSEGRWTKIGDVVGGEGDDVKPTTSKVMYEGKEYDYVFDVDIEEGSRPLKLPYNTNEDPWHVAQKFIHKNDLSQMFLDQIANFIIQNTKGVVLGQSQPATAADPFTGGSRYIPGTGADPLQPQQAWKQAQTAPTPETDPFTGGSKYTPSYSSGPTLSGDSVQTPPTNPYFPQETFVMFDTGNTTAIIGKIKEFNSVIDLSQRLSDEDLSSLEKFIQVALNPNSATPSSQQLQLLWQLLQWPSDKVFPVLDVLRLAIRHPVVNQHFCNPQDSEQFFRHLLKICGDNASSANRMLVLRTLCNTFSHKDGVDLMQASQERLVSSATEALSTTHKGVHIAFATLLLNLSVLLRKSDDVEARSQCVSAIVTLLLSENEMEAVFRLQVALGTLVKDDDNVKAIANSLDIANALDKFVQVKEPSKVGECAKFLKQVL